MLPRVEPVTAPGGGGAGAGVHGGAGIDSGVMGRRLDASMAELEIDGLRPYREGTSASRIHWPSVARSGEMLERRLVAELDSAPLIVLDAVGAGRTRRGSTRRCAPPRRCASISGHAGGCAILLPGERRPVEIGHDLAGWCERPRPARARGERPRAARLQRSGRAAAP